MKRVLLTLVATATIAVSSYGQSLNFSGGFTTSNIRIKGGEDLSETGTFDGGAISNSIKKKNSNGYNIAIGYEFKFGDRFSLETGLKFQTRGFITEKEVSSKVGSDYYGEIRIETHKRTYLDLPIVLNTEIIRGDVRAYAKTGIYVAYLALTRYNRQSEYTFSNRDNLKDEINLKLNSGDFKNRITGGLVLGAGVAYKEFFFETNYNTGAFSFSSVPLDNKMYTWDLSFTLGYKLNFNK